MPTVQEMLLQTGFTQAQIDAMDAKAINVFSGVLSTAEQKEKEARDAAEKAEQARVAAQQAREAAELEKRSNVEFYETKVMPGLLGFEEEKKTLEAARINAESKAVFYEAQVKGLKDTGFLPQDAPAFLVPNPAPPVANNGGGRFVAGPNGSPVFDEKSFVSKVGDAYNTINDIMYEHQVLYGKPLPIAPSQLIAQADALKLTPAAYAERTFNFAAKKQEMAAAAKQAEFDQVRAAERTEQETKWKAEIEKVRSEGDAERKKMMERAGNNPEVRVAVSAKMPDVARATKAGERPDPLKMSDAQRRSFTREQIHKEVAENAAVA